MTHTLYLDTETYNETPITAGTYRYAESAEIMMIQWAIDDGPVSIWDYSEGLLPPDLVSFVENYDAEAIAHNSMFDRNVMRLGDLKMTIPIERWRCTMVQSMQHAFPGGLEAVGKILGLPQDLQKNKEGKALIQKFCKPHPVRVNRRTEALHAVPLANDLDIGSMVYFGADLKKAVRENKFGYLAGILPAESRSYIDIDGKKHGTARAFDGVSRAMNVPDEVRIDMVRYTPKTHPAEWARFREYGKQDIVTLREVHRRLPDWNWQPDDIAMWHLDQRINDRGFAVDIELAEAGARAATEEKTYLNTRFAELTGGLQPTQRAKVQEFINTMYALGIESTAKPVMEPIAADETQPPALRELANIMLSANKTSTAKYGKIVEAMSADGRFRGGLQFSGAQRTRRWAGRIFQPQNLPSRGLPHGDLIELYIAALKTGVHREVFDDLMLYGSAALRGVVTV